MKHILALIPSLGMGGAEKAFVVWVEGLQSLGYRVSVATTEPEEDFFLLPEGISRWRRASSQSVRWFSHARRLVDPWVNARFIQGVIQHIQPHVVVAHLPKAAIPALIASQRERVSCFVMEHSYQVRLRDPLLNFLRPRLYAHAQALVVLTPAMGAIFQSFNRRLVQIANPVVKPPVVGSFEEKEKVILLAGRLISLKQFDLFVARLANFDLEDWHVWIAGEGPERAKIERILDEQGLKEKVILLGVVEDMSAIYRRASLFVLCSLWEGFPLVLAESALYGCVRVSFECPSGPEILIQSGETGFLVENQNWEALFVCLASLMHSPSLRYELYRASLALPVALDPLNVALAWQVLLEGERP